MNVLTWNDTFSVGVRRLDDEHRKLFGLLMALEASIRQSRQPETPARLLVMLEEATRAHFAEEEALMRAAKYSGLALHSASHVCLIEELETFGARHGRGEQPLNQHALNFLGNWLVDHIQTDDLRLGDWLRERKPCPDADVALALEG